MTIFLRRHSRILIGGLALAILFTIYLATHPRGASIYVLTIWSNQGLLLALAAIAQFFVVLVRGIDLSVGPTVALTNVVASFLVHGEPAQVAVGLVASLSVGVLCGLVNGVAVVYGRMQPIVATLATANVISGVALMMRPTPGGEINDTLSDALTYDIGGVPTSMIVLLIVLALITVPLRRSPIGLALYAIGSSEQSAYMTGARVGLVKLVAYAAGGFFSALAGLYLSMVTLTGDAGVAPAYTLNSIAAVVLGGVALTGGVGSPLGAAIGAFVLKTISSLMFFSGLPPLAQPFFEGLILAVAIMLGSLQVLRLRSRIEAIE